MTDLELLGSGRSADVYALDRFRVLRRYRTGIDARPEAALMAHVSAHGFPVPEVHAAEGPELVMERLTGATMLGALLAGEMAPQEGARLLARLHQRLHEVPALHSPDVSDRVLHLDLHPDNVVLTEAGPVVIDWSNGDDGPPEVDLAMTAVIMAQVVLTGAPQVPAEAREAAGVFLGEYLAVITGDPLRGLAKAVALRSADPYMSPAELDALTSAQELIRAGSTR